MSSRQEKGHHFRGWKAVNSFAKCNVTAFSKVVLQFVDQNVPSNGGISPWEGEGGIKAHLALGTGMKKIFGSC